MTADDDALARDAYALHEALRAWLDADAPSTDPIVIMTALSYEIGRQVGAQAEGRTTREVDALLDHVRRVMRAHVAAAQRGGQQ